MAPINRQSLPVSIGLGYKNPLYKKPLVADILVDWGGEVSFLSAVQSIIEPKMVWEKWKHITRNKETAPYAIWSIFATGSKGRSKSDVLAHTALVFDLDSGNIAEAHLRATLQLLGWESAVYSTWSAKPDDLRWRVIVPLSRPHGVSGWEGFYKAKVSNFTSCLASIAGVRIEIDLSAHEGNRPQILPHILPSTDVGIAEENLAAIFTAMEKHVKGAPSFSKPIQFGTAGSPLYHASAFVLSDGARRTLSLDDIENKGKVKAAGKPSGKPSQGAVEPTPYVGVASAEGVSATRLWAANGFDQIIPLWEGLDGAEVLCQKGIRVQEDESRQLTLVSAMWAQHRAGMSVQEIMKASHHICEASKKSDYKYLTEQAAKFLKQLRKFEEEAKAYETAIFAALKEGTGNNKVDGEVVFGSSKRLFARILSRCAHLRSEKGGKLSQAQIAVVLGYPKSLKEFQQPGCDAVRAMLGKCERAGLLAVSGEKKARTYRLLPLS